MVRSHASAGHLSVRVDGQHPADIPFRFERSQKRVAPAAIASAISHVTFSIFVILLVRHGSPRGAAPMALSAQSNARIVWFNDRGPGGGGGGGGNRMREPPRLAELPGHDTITIPVAKRLSPATTDSPREPDPIERLSIPARSFAAAQASLPGAIEAPAWPGTASRGRGSGPGAGSGAGTGIGDGDGSGLGAGRGGNSGGDVYRPGDDVTLPRLLKQVKPQYTAEAMRAKVQGTVLLACIVRPDGTVGDVLVLQSLDRTFGLDQQAIIAAKQWTFAPGRRRGEAVSVQVTIELTFTLR